MADASTASPGDVAGVGGIDLDALVKQANALPNVDTAGITKKVGEETKKEVAALEPIRQRQLEAIRADTARAHAAYEGIEPVDVKPWNADEEHAKRSTNPIEAFGSLGSVFAIIASAFTKTPMVNALNGAAAAMNAIKDKDEKAYERAYDAWKTNTNLAMKRHEMQREAYGDALKLLETDNNAATAELRAVAARFDDKKALALIDGGYIKELIDLQAARANAARGMIAAMPQIERMAVQRKAAQELKAQGKSDLEVYRQIYAPAYSQTLGNMKSRLIMEKAQAIASQAGRDSPTPEDVLAAARDVEQNFNPRAAAQKDSAKVGLEIIQNLQKPVKEGGEGIVLTPEQSALIRSTFENAGKSNKSAQLTDRLLQAIEEIKQRKQTDGEIGSQEVSKILHSAFEAGDNLKIDQAIVNQLKFYPGMDRKQLGYIGPKSQERIISSFTSVENIEHIADYAAKNPEAVGLLADAARRINIDAYAGLLKSPANYITKITTDRDAAIDAAAKAGHIPLEMAQKAKVLNKMLATQAFADAAQAGSRGATIYLDKAFREIYQQASSLPAFFEILHTRQWDANNNLDKYNLGLDKRSDASETLPFWKGGTDAFVKKAAETEAERKAPRQAGAIVEGRGGAKYRFKGGDPSDKANYELVQ